MSYRETRSERAATARWNQGARPYNEALDRFKFRWMIFKEKERKKRDHYGFINIDLKTAELMRDWLAREISRPRFNSEDSEITFMLSGFDNMSESGEPYIGGLGSPKLSHESLPAKPKRQH